jgi:hypothetical protein
MQNKANKNFSHNDSFYFGFLFCLRRQAENCNSVRFYPVLKAIDQKCHIYGAFSAVEALQKIQKAMILSRLSLSDTKLRLLSKTNEML